MSVKDTSGSDIFIKKGLQKYMPNIVLENTLR